MGSEAGRSLKLAEGREAEVFEHDAGKVVRLLRDHNAHEHNALQGRVLDLVVEMGGPAPRFFGTIQMDGRPGIIIERIEGPSLLALLESKPWKLREVGGLMGKLHSEIHRVQALEEVSGTRTLLTRALNSNLVPPDLAEAALSNLQGLPDGEQLLHGDFHPDNIMGVSDRAVVIDWSNVSRGNPHADVARTLVMLKWAQPQGVSPAMSLLAKYGRTYLLRRYLASYRQAAKLDLALLESWGKVVAVARLAEGIEEERGALISWARAVSGSSAARG